MKAEEIRAKFLKFFEKRGHHIVSSAPLVLKNDPSLMFVNAGMNPFKEYFLGNKTSNFERVADTQKCLRVRGKHNDLEEVGLDTYHHTLFEMLGNWSFGDYFKEDAIAWAWELLTAEYGINKDRLYVTVFEGSEAEGLMLDEQARDYWKKWIAEDRIILGDKKDNFWEMGETGPCGPSSEIHVDIRSDKERNEKDGRELVNKDHPEVVEIWNLVFIEFNRKANGSLEPLPAQHIDTGMGFERLCMVLQGVKSNYDTDIFTPLIKEIETITHSKYGSKEATNIAIRVVADHLRAVSFAIADGQLPSNTGAGYVIRRILRRAIRYGFTFLEQKQPFIFKLVDTLSFQMKSVFPEVETQKHLIQNVLREEESSFLRTLEQGLLLLDDIINEEGNGKIPGDKVFELYDTYGFPKDLTALILREKGLTYDEPAFELALEQQKQRSRKATKISHGDWVLLTDLAETRFVGYDSLQASVQIMRYRKVDNAKLGQQFQLVFDVTPFYAEGGGQVGDKGYLEAANGDVIYITDTKKENNLIVHYCDTLPQDLVGAYTAVVDMRQRSRTAANHTATHLLHQALRTVLGNHVEQKGSMVHNGYLRFDFSHFSKLNPAELEQVGQFVNSRIDERLPLIENREQPYEEAIKQGALALFGEKYGDNVRSIRFGESMELCGGTHVQNTGDIWHFIIISETAVAAGVRRIEAITFDAAKDYFVNQTEDYKMVRQLLKNTNDPIKNITQLQQENQQLKKHVEQLLKEKVRFLGSEMLAKTESLNGLQFLASEIDLVPSAVKDLLFEMGKKTNNLFALLASTDNQKVILSCYISKSLVQEKGYHAGNIVKQLGKFINGGGGGQPFFATAGGKNPDGIPKALQEARSFL